MNRFFAWLALSLWAWGQPRHLPVLCYHQVSLEPTSEMATTPELLGRQLDFLQDQGYTTISLEQAQAFLGGKLPALKVAKPVLLTFDDGYNGVYRYAFPRLKQRRMRAITFLVSSQVGVMKPNPHLSQAQIREMSGSGVFEFGSHTHQMHIPLPESWAAGRVSGFAIQQDLIRSRQQIQRLTGRPVRALAWPYGHYDEACLKLARDSGFHLVFTTDYGYNFPGSGPWRIRRIRLSSLYDTVDVLRAKLLHGG